MASKTETRKYGRTDRESLFDREREVYRNGSSLYVCPPAAGADILDLERGDEVLIRDLEDGDIIEIFSVDSAPSSLSGLVVGERRVIQGRENHPSIECNIPSRYDFEDGDDVTILVFADRFRIRKS